MEYITGNAGKVENAYTYDAFGNIIGSTEPVKNRYTYNGEQYDQISQQYFLRARNYNPLIGRFTQEDVYRGDGLNLYAYCGNNPVMYVDPSGYIKDWNTPESNTDLLNIYNADTSKGKKDSMNSIKFIEVEASDIETFNNTNWNDSDVIQIDLTIDGKRALQYNKTGELGLLNEHMIEQNIVLNKISTENPDILQQNLGFSNGVYSSPGNSSKSMVDSYRSEGRKILLNNGKMSSGQTPHALDTCAGGSANIFLNDFRNKYANGTMGSVLYKQKKKIVPGKKHKLNLVVKGKNGKNISIDEYLKQHGTEMDKSKCKVKK